MNVGFTGTRKGMTYEQKRSLAVLLDRYGAQHYYPNPNNLKFLHGKCLGADEEAARIAANKGYITVAYPSDRADWTSSYKSDIEMPIRKHPIERNKDIVKDCDLMIACPSQKEEPRSMRAGGTWFTVRFARNKAKVSKRVIIIWPNGNTEVREPDGTRTS